MIGDGANDLLAIRAADLGIGITNSDAIYGSSFSVTTLLQVCQIIRESKNTERQIL